MAHDVFISYAHQDKAVADAACVVLERRGVRCWIAPRDVTPGLDWSAEIVDAIAASRVLVLIYTANSNASHQIKREVERAVAAGHPVLPVRVEDVPMSKALEYFISTPHWLDALSPPLEAHLERLAGTVGVLLGDKPGPRHPVPGASVAVPRSGPKRRTVLLVGGAIGAALLGVVGWRVLGGGGGGANLDRKFVGEWSLATRDARGAWTGTLTIERNGRFGLELGVEDTGTMTAGGGRYRMVTAAGVPVTGIYARQGTVGLSITGPLGTATWTRQAGGGGAGGDLVGTWRLDATVEGLPTTTTFMIAPGGTYRIRTSTPDRGRIEGGDGLFKMVSAVSGKVVSGTYEFSARDRVSLVGPGGPALWIRR